MDQTEELTIHSMSSIANKVFFNIDHDDQFIVCDNLGEPLANGSFLFNLDSLSRASNADVRHPAQFLVKRRLIWGQIYHSKIL